MKNYENQSHSPMDTRSYFLCIIVDDGICQEILGAMIFLVIYFSLLVATKWAK
jgi:hypothetical protein